jgi:hypothetical protein
MSKVAEGWEPSRETMAQPSAPFKFTGFHQDSRVPGPIEQVADLAYARRVATAYYMRYAPEAYRQGHGSAGPHPFGRA